MHERSWKEVEMHSKKIFQKVSKSFFLIAM
jgi:hypothetical protein